MPEGDARLPRGRTGPATPGRRHVPTGSIPGLVATSRLVAAFGPAGVLDPGGDPSRRVAFGLVDTFSETIPSTEHTTGVAFHFDAPGARAPQAILVAVPPKVDVPLDTATLVAIVAETRDAAHARMATPADIDALGAALPLTVLPANAPAGVTLLPGLRASRCRSVSISNSRLEPRRPGGDLDDGFRARVADPLWFLGRQWQMGEHQGEDAASPVRCGRAQSARRRSTTSTAIQPRSADDHPAEAIIESEPGDWWTVGRRVRIGLAARQGGACRTGRPRPTRRCGCGELVAPYDGLNGGYDGRALYERACEPRRCRAPLFAEVPARSRPTGGTRPSSSMAHGSPRAAAGVPPSTSRVTTAATSTGTRSTPPARSRPIAPLAPAHLTPGRLRYPGAPHPRWWQIEDARVDIGGLPARSRATSPRCC